MPQTRTVGYSPDAEWLEPDGLGGFASGTVGGARTRRYHALLLAATTPPTGRVALVNGIEAWLETGAGRFALSSQRYTPDVTYPDGASRVAAFRPEPWPAWTFRCEDGTEVAQEVVAVQGRPEVVLRWRRTGGDGPARLVVRPLLSGRDYHGLHHENPAFGFAPETAPGRVTWRPYPGLPAVTALANGEYRHDPAWYRNFLYAKEVERGLDAVEDLASPGELAFDLAARDAVLVLRAGEPEAGAVSPEILARGHLKAEAARRAAFASPLHRAADAYVVRRGAGRTVVAGYPWFTDWGRDTFITLRGLLTVARRGRARARHPAGLGRRRVARHAAEPLPRLGRAAGVQLGRRRALVRGRGARLPAGGAPAGRAGRRRRAGRAGARDRGRSSTATGRARATASAPTTDGLLAAGEPGLQLTWMDAKIGDWVVTPRIGKPVEVQALWLNALAIGRGTGADCGHLYRRARAAFQARFWNPERGCLYDVVDADHVPGRNDPSFRPNQILAVGGLPFQLLDEPQASRVVDAVERELLTPLGLRSLAPRRARLPAPLRGRPASSATPPTTRARPGPG